MESDGWGQGVGVQMRPDSLRRFALDGQRGLEHHPARIGATIMNYNQRWQEQGYLVVRNLFDSTRLTQLLEATESACEQWRRDSRPESEPFGYAYAPTAWVLNHLNHPKYYRQHPEWLPRLLDVVATPLAQKSCATFAARRKSSCRSTAA